MAQIHQYPGLLSLGNNDLFPVSHSNNVYSMKYSTLASTLEEATSAFRQGYLATNTNLDDVLTPGLYALSGSYTYTNLPTGATYGILEVSRATTATDYTVQTVTSSNGRTWKRMYISGGTAHWQDWQEFVRTGQQILSGTTQATSITFATTFAAAPAVTVTVLNGSTQYVTNVILTEVTASGFKINKRYWNEGTSAWTTSAATVHWIAVGTQA